MGDIVYCRFAQIGGQIPENIAVLAGVLVLREIERSAGRVRVGVGVEIVGSQSDRFLAAELEPVHDMPGKVAGVVRMHESPKEIHPN